MTMKDCRPDLWSYNTVIYGLVKKGRFNEAFSMFCQMKKVLIPDYATLCTILPCFVKIGLMKEALRTVKEYFLQPGSKMDRSSCYSLMEGILNKAGTEKSFEFAENMASSGIILNDFFPCPLIRRLCKQKKALEAHELVKKFKTFGNSLKTGSYIALICGLVDENLIDIAEGLFAEMKELGCGPDEFTYNFILDAMGKSMLIVQEEMHHKGYESTYVTYNTIISGLVKSRRLE
ncbi:hypothetical protein ABZP36_034497 [Zizania latifolia]